MKNNDLRVSVQEKQKLLRAGWTKDEITQLEIQRDPVLWAETFLRNPDQPNKPLLMRWYQKDMLRSTVKKKVYRCGRRVGKSIVLCVEMLWNAFNNNDLGILVCTPYKNQVSELWKDGFLKLIKGNEYIEASINRIGQNPFTIEFKNGSRILGMTAGSSTGNKGSSIRGISAGKLYLDEVDYMGDAAIQSIMAIMATKKGSTFTISSTPTGKREFFYDACSNKSLGYTEFNFPSSVSPEWISIEEAKEQKLPLHESQEYLFRNQNPEHVFSHEYLAEFGEEAQGVFKHRFIDASLITYDPEVEKSDPRGLMWWCGEPQNSDHVYAMGVDWNGDKVGTQIVIVELLKTPTEITHIVRNTDDGTSSKVTSVFDNKYRLYYRESISIKDMTQIASVAKIIELNNRFKLDHIYVDAGFGTTNIEELRLHGMRNRESDLARKIKPIEFGGSLQVYDPFTRTREKKSVKPFMVNGAATSVENGQVILPTDEDEKIKLVGQMREFCVDRISALGVPTYSKGNDHILDAFMLALLAFQMEYSTFVKAKQTTIVDIVSNPKSLVIGLEKVNERGFNDKDDKSLSKYATKRTALLGCDKYTTDSKARYHDYEHANSTSRVKSPFSSNVGKVSWTKLTGAPRRATF